jgi:tripartite-type tricarboxylate transporter receptor subunit TctC
MRNARLALGGLLLALGAHAAAAEHPSTASGKTYPARPVRMIVPLVPGGSVDTMARALAQKMSDTMGQQVVVDNRGGASGNIGTEIAARAAPDGYTIMTVSMTVVVNQFLFPKVPFDPVRDFAPISLIASAPQVLTVHPSVPVKSTKELIAFAKANPGKLHYPSSGKGTNSHLSMELFKSMAHVDIVDVPYRGGGPGQIALLAGEVQVGFNNPPNALPHINAGRLRALAMTTEKRSSLLPDLPTVAESGVPGYTFSTWYGVLAPAGIPTPIRDALHGHVAGAMRSPEIAHRFAYEGAEIIASSPAQFAAHIKSEVARWGKVLKQRELAQKN